MRVLVHGLNYAPEPIGAGKFTGETAVWLAARGHEVRVVTSVPYYPGWRRRPGYPRFRYRYERADGVGVLRCPLWVPRRPDGWRRALHLASFALFSAPALLWTALTFRPEALFVVAPTISSAPAAWLAGRMAGARLWLHLQDFEIDAAFGLGLVASSGRMRRMAAALEGWVLGRFDRVSTISPRMRARLLAKGVAADRTRLFPNGVDTAGIYPSGGISEFRRSLAVPEPAIVALYAGNLGEKQGIETLLAVARICHRNGAGHAIHVVICGEGAASAKLAAADIPNLRLLALQPAARLNDLLNAADIHLLPQRAGAADLVMPSKLGGMLASGRPVVAGAAPGTQIADEIADCGIRVPPDDAPAMAAAIVELAGDPDRRRKLGEAARRRAVQFWDRDKIMTDFARDLALAVNEVD